MTKVTYHAPKNDAEIAHLRGIRFIDGQAVDVEDNALVAKLRGNPHFEVEGGPEQHDKAVGSNGGLRAVHRGRGVYLAMDGDVVLDQVGQMNKEEADTFNALSDEEKADFVNRPLDPVPPGGAQQFNDQ